jgi:hypothetical protein
MALVGGGSVDFRYYVNTDRCECVYACMAFKLTEPLQAITEGPFLWFLVKHSLTWKRPFFGSFARQVPCDILHAKEVGKVSSVHQGLRRIETYSTYITI